MYTIVTAFYLLMILLFFETHSNIGKAMLELQNDINKVTDWF